MREMKPEKPGKRASPALMNNASVSERRRKENRFYKQYATVLVSGKLEPAKAVLNGP